MSVSAAAMSASEMAAWLVATGTYQTYADAAAALNIVIIDGVGAASTAIAVSGGAGTAVSALGQTALEVAADASLAATGTQVTSGAIGLVGASGGGIAPAGLMGVEMGVVVAAAAPLLGVALGASMYQSNPQLWTHISQKLLPFCYPGTTKIPTWAQIVDDAWQVSILKKVVDALKEVFEEEEVPVTETIDPISYNYQGCSCSVVGSVVEDATYRYESSEGFVVTSISSSGTVCTAYSRVPGVVQIIRKEDGEVVGTQGISTQESLSDGSVAYIGTSVNAQGSMGSAPYPPGLTWRNILDCIYLGSSTGPTPGVYPSGTSQWGGTTPSSIPEVQPGAVVDTDGQGGAIFEPLTPISIPYYVPDPNTEPKPDDWPAEVPYTEPVPSPDPEVQPDPTKTDDPESQVDPYIQTLPVPWETTDPDNDEDTQTDPTLDPSRPRPPVQIVTDVPVDLGPEPIGISPWPVLPDTPSSFPLDGSAGLITVYNPTPSELYAFESWLWVTLSQASVQTVWNNPFDGVIGLFELYCTPTINGNKTIRSAFLDSGIYSDTVSRYTEIDCGTLGIPEYYGNYLDYSPYTKAHIYLPFIGIQELNVDDIVGHAVNVTYRIDEYNGSCIAMITVAKVTQVNGEDVEYSNTMYQFSGNCAVELPISGGNQSSILAGMMTANAYQQAAQLSANAQMIGGIASIVGGVASLALGGIGGIGGIGSGISQMGQSAATAAYGQASALSNMLSGKATVQKSGSFGSSHGALGIKTPFITITRPKQIQVANYNELYGYPAHKMVTIGSCTGFIRCREVHVISASASDAEKAVIESMLKTGVYVTS